VTGFPLTDAVTVPQGGTGILKTCRGHKRDGNAAGVSPERDRDAGQVHACRIPSFRKSGPENDPFRGKVKPEAEKSLDDSSGKPGGRRRKITLVVDSRLFGNDPFHRWFHDAPGASAKDAGAGCRVARFSERGRGCAGREDGFLGAQAGNPVGGKLVAVVHDVAFRKQGGANMPQGCV